MVEGYMVEGEAEQFCSAECLDMNYPNTSTELNAMSDDELDNSLIFWTDWVEEYTEDELKELGWDMTSEVSLALGLDPKPTVPASGVKVEGHRGTWYTIATETFGLGGMLAPEPLYLMEHETYGDEAPCVIINLKGELVMENVHNGFDDLRYCIEEGIDPMTY
jgi:hypothetical protein